MGDDDKTFNTICRVCLKHEQQDKLVSLIDLSQVTGLSMYGSTLEEITKVPVKQNRYLPMNMCQKCCESLEGVSRFIMACKVNNRKLKKLIQFSIQHDLDGSMVKEVVNQYTLFSENLPEKLGTLEQSNTLEYEENVTKNQATKTEQVYSIVKVEKPNSSNVDNYESNDDSEDSIDIKTDVDIFISSIKKLVTANIDLKPIKPSTNKAATERHDETKKSKKLKPKAEKDLTCNICQKVLANELTFKHHVERHGVCRFVCDQCGKSFPTNAELVQHQIHIHGAGSQYECDLCSYRAAKKIQLIEHIRLHTGERPFTCEICGLTFRRKTLYNKHAKFHGERMIQCDYCPKKFFVRSAMLAHRNSRHNREYIFSCKICNVTYAMAKTVKKHMLDKHGIPNKLQGKIQKVYKNETDKSFQKRVRGELIYL